MGGVRPEAVVARSIKAPLIDGGIRDTHQILDQNFPVFDASRCPNSSVGRCLMTHDQTPILSRGVVIKPGDVIVGHIDIDGGGGVPRGIDSEVLVRAEAIRENEKQIIGQVADGQTVQPLTAQGGYFQPAYEFGRAAPPSNPSGAGASADPPTFFLPRLALPHRASRVSPRGRT